jgi:hypothetical protein
MELGFPTRLWLEVHELGGTFEDPESANTENEHRRLGIVLERSVFRSP